MVLFVGVLSAVIGATAAPATTSSFFYVPLTSDLIIPATSPVVPNVVLSYELTLGAGEARRVSDRLELTLSSSEGAEVSNTLVCLFLDPVSGWRQFTDQASVGTNHPGSGGGAVVLTQSLLLRAEAAGRYRCEIRSYAGDNRLGFHSTALKSGAPFSTTGTWLHISATDEAGAQEWYTPVCGSDGTGDCTYLGAQGDPISRNFFQPPNGNPERWTARSDATTVEVVGAFQVTSCPHGSRSCTTEHWGEDGFLGNDATKTKRAAIYSHLQFNQLYPDGTVCRVHISYDQATDNHHVITNSVHHMPIAYRLTVPVSQNCRGSRTFAPHVHVRWHDGNPVKVDGGNINVINKVRTSTATVPNVLRTTEAEATAALRARGFTVSVIRQVDPAPAGTVIDQNSPAGTVEPGGSQVTITVSQGRAVVPYLTGDGEASARAQVIAAGLTVGGVSHPDTCVDPGVVSSQSPAPGTVVLPGTSVNLTVPVCKRGIAK
jgi:hypothetical protein